MDVDVQPTEMITRMHLVPAGEDRYGENKILGLTTAAMKITSRESKDLYAVELTLTQKGGPARHVHFEQDEWFYILEGNFIIEVGDQRFNLGKGDSLFAPRKVPHVWAFVGDGRGRFLGSVMPAGNLEAFFVNAAKTKIYPGPDQNLWRPYGMEWVGPPLKID